MASKMMKVVSAGAVVLALGAGGYAWMRANTLDTLKKDLDAFLAAKGMTESVRYGSLTAPLLVGPSGPVTINALQLIDPKAPAAAPLATLSTVTVSKVAKTNDVLKNGHTEIQDLNITPQGLIYLLGHTDQMPPEIRAQVASVIEEAQVSLSLKAASFDFEGDSSDTTKTPTEVTGSSMSTVSQLRILAKKPETQDVPAPVFLMEEGSASGKLTVSGIDFGMTSGAGKMKDITIPLEFATPPIKTPITIGEFSISDMEMFKSIMTRSHTKVADIKIPLLEISQALKDSEEEDAPIFELVKMGYNTLVFHIDTNSNIGVKDGTLSADLSMKVNEAGSFRMKYALSKLDPKFIDAYIELQQSMQSLQPGNSALMAKLMGMMPLIANVALDDLQLDVQDLGLKPRLIKAYAEKKQITESLDQVTANLANQTKENSLAGLMMIGTSEALATDLSNKLSLFMKDGGALKFATHIKTPVPLFVQKDGMIQDAAPELQTLEGFFKATEATLER